MDHSKDIPQLGVDFLDFLRNSLKNVSEPTNSTMCGPDFDADLMDENNNSSSENKPATAESSSQSSGASPKPPPPQQEQENSEVCRVLLVPYKTKQEIEAASEDFTGCPDDFEIIYLDHDTCVDSLLDYKKSEGFHEVLVVNPRIKSMRFYFCGICKLKILTLNDMLRHVIAKHFNFRWKCDICEKTFSRASDRKRHFKNVHESDGVRYLCSQCNMVFDESFERDDHIRLTHDGGKIPNLDSSNSTMEGGESSSSSANSSLLMMSNVCTVCDQVFESYQVLDRHRRDQHDSQPLYRCYTCSERFTSRHILRMHRTGSHVIRSCPACKASFKRSIDLKRHFKRAHPFELPNFPSLAMDHNEEARQMAAQHKQQQQQQPPLLPGKISLNPSTMTWLPTPPTTQPILGFPNLTSLQSMFSLLLAANQSTTPIPNLPPPPLGFPVLPTQKLGHSVTNLVGPCSPSSSPPVQKPVEKVTNQGTSGSRMWKGTLEYQNRAFQCDVCSSRFTRNYHLQRHMRTVHSISDFYKCAHCTAKYGNRANLEKHFLSAHYAKLVNGGYKKLPQPLPGSSQELMMRIDDEKKSDESGVGGEETMFDQFTGGYRRKSSASAPDPDEYQQPSDSECGAVKRRRKNLLPKKYLLPEHSNRLMLAHDSLIE